MRLVTSGRTVIIVNIVYLPNKSTCGTYTFAGLSSGLRRERERFNGGDAARSWWPRLAFNKGYGRPSLPPRWPALTTGCAAPLLSDAAARRECVHARSVRAAPPLPDALLRHEPEDRERSLKFLPIFWFILEDKLASFEY